LASQTLSCPQRHKRFSAPGTCRPAPSCTLGRFSPRRPLHCQAPQPCPRKASHLRLCCAVSMPARRTDKPQPSDRQRTAFCGSGPSRRSDADAETGSLPPLRLAIVCGNHRWRRREQRTHITEITPWRSAQNMRRRASPNPQGADAQRTHPPRGVEHRAEGCQPHAHDCLPLKCGRAAAEHNTAAAGQHCAQAKRARASPHCAIKQRGVPPQASKNDGTAPCNMCRRLAPLGLHRGASKAVSGRTCSKRTSRSNSLHRQKRKGGRRAACCTRKGEGHFPLE
jgi:hypothetical protein